MHVKEQIQPIDYLVIKIKGISIFTPVGYAILTILDMTLEFWHIPSPSREFYLAAWYIKRTLLHQKHIKNWDSRVNPEANPQIEIT